MNEKMEYNDINDIRWKGYVRNDKRLGIRNKLLVIYTVECAAFVAKKIVLEMNREDVEVIGFSGCTDNAYAIRMIVSLIRHPNVGAVLAVGLGCEYLQPNRLAEAAQREGKAGNWILIQEEGGTNKAIQKGIELVRRMIREIADVARADMGWSDLIVGAECGGSDFTSGLAGNPLVGSFFDWLIEREGTAIFEEIVEAVGLAEMLKRRAVDKDTEKKLGETYEKAMNYCKSVRQYSISPGNFVGGISTIEEKSMGALAKSGTKPIQGVLKVAESPGSKGLWLLDTTPDPHWMQFGITNPNDNEGLMDLICSGAQVLFLVTGRGNVVGSAVAPVIKITGNHTTFLKMREDMDFDAGALLFGCGGMRRMTEKLGKLVAAVCGGKRTCAEMLGHAEYFIPYKYQERQKKEGENKPCRNLDACFH